MSTGERALEEAAACLGQVLEEATHWDEGFHAMWRSTDGLLVIARACDTAPPGHGLVDLAFARPGENARDLAENAVDAERWTQLGLTIGVATEFWPLAPHTIPSHFDRDPAGGWVNAFRASNVVDADPTPSQHAGDRAIDVLAGQLQRPGTKSVSWLSDRDPTDPEGPRVPTVVAIKMPTDGASDRVDVFARQNSTHGFAFVTAGNVDHDTLRSIAPLHPQHVARYGSMFDRVATEKGSSRDVDTVAELLADALHKATPGVDRAQLLSDAHRSIDGAASAQSRTAALRWLTSSLNRDVRQELAKPTGAELLKNRIHDALEVARTRVRPLKSAMHAVREDPAQDRDRTPTITR